jgi:hypothetical protein
MKGLWLRLGEAATGQPAAASGPRPARPALPPMFGAEPIVAFERELGDDAGAREQEEEVEARARPGPDPAGTPDNPRTEAAPVVPAEDTAGAPSQQRPSRGGEALPLPASRRHATVAQPPAGPGTRADSSRFGGDREVSRAHPRTERTLRGEPAQEGPSTAPPRPVTGAHLSTPLIPRPERRDPGAAGIARLAAVQALRPLQNEARRAARASGQGTPAPSPGDTDSTAPAVEIRIGRIEVRAVRAPSPPRQSEPRPAAPQVSLEEYLRARTAGR